VDAISPAFTGVTEVVPEVTISVPVTKRKGRVDSQEPAQKKSRIQPETAPIGVAHTFSFTRFADGRHYPRWEIARTAKVSVAACIHDLPLLKVLSAPCQAASGCHPRKAISVSDRSLRVCVLTIVAEYLYRAPELVPANVRPACIRREAATITPDVVGESQCRTSELGPANVGPA
jgi:hypothetical protein